MRRFQKVLLGCLLTSVVWGTSLSGIKTVSGAEEFNSAAKKLHPGDTLVLADGIWKNAALVIKARGTEEQPVVVKAAKAGGVTLTGRSTLRIGGEWTVVEGLLFKDGELAKAEGSVVEFRTRSDQPATNCRLTNSAIINYNPSDKHLDYKWVSLYGRNNRVDRCSFIGKNHQGTLLVVWLDSLPNYHRIDHNYFGPRPEHDQNGAEIIRVGTSDWSMFVSKTVVEYNLFHRCNGELEIISNKSCENVYRYNTFRECMGALTLRHGNRCDVYGNWFFGNRKTKTGGVRIIGEDHRVFNNWFQELAGDDRFSPLSVMDGVKNSPLNGYYQVKNALVVHNTFVRCTRGIVIGIQNNAYENFLPPDTLVVVNNLFAEVPLPFSASSFPNAPILQNNGVQGAAIGLPAGFTSAALRLEEDTEGVVRIDGAPPALREFRFVTTDIDGTPRSRLVHQGADEGGGALSLNPPLRRENVGAGWWEQ